MALCGGGRVPLPQVRHFKGVLGELALDPFRVVECTPLVIGHHPSSGTLRMTVLSSAYIEFGIPIEWGFWVKGETKDNSFLDNTRTMSDVIDQYMM